MLSKKARVTGFAFGARFRLSGLGVASLIGKH
jgi:hypothetical protein